VSTKSAHVLFDNVSVDDIVKIETIIFMQQNQHATMQLKLKTAIC